MRVVPQDFGYASPAVEGVTLQVGDRIVVRIADGPEPEATVG